MPGELINQRSLILVGLLFAASVVPVLSVKIPAMVDYVNHLARMHLLVDAAAGRPTPAYEIDWRLYPNLAVDIIVPVMARFVSAESATRLFLLASQTLVVSGAIALEIEVRGRHQLSGFAALIALYSLPFLWGLTNFEFGCGVALWAIVFWIHYREGPWLVWIALHTGFVVVLFVAHLFALGIYGLTIGCYESSRTPGYRQAARTFAVMVFPVIAAYLFLVWSHGAVGKPVFDWGFGLKLIWPLLVMNGYSVPLSIALAVTIVALLVFLGYNRVFWLTRPAVFIGSGFLIAYLLMPNRLQPIRKAASKSRFEIKDSLDYLPTTISQLNSASAGETAPPRVRGWRAGYVYLYLVGDQTASIPDNLTSMMRGRRFTLYAIGK